MSYEKTGNKKLVDAKGAMLKVASNLKTSSLIWLLVKRHKVALLAIGNIVLLLNWAIPAWPEIVKSFFN